MTKKVKVSSQLPGPHNLVTQSFIPHPATSPYVTLHMRQKQQERLINEQERLKRRNHQIKNQLKIVAKDMERLLKIATGKEWVESKGNPDYSSVESLEDVQKSKTLIEY